MKRSTIYIIGAILLVIIILAIIFKDKIKALFSEENYRDIQYFINYDNAINDQSYLPSIEGCTEECKQVNKKGNITHVAECMDSCMHTSGYIPTISMLTDMQELVQNL
jgi:hypothetical protein